MPSTDVPPPASPPSPGRPVQSVLHALNVLQALEAADEPVGVTETAERVGLSKATVYQLLATLESRRIVARDRVTGRYALGWGLYELGVSVVRDASLAQLARPLIDELAIATGETVLLGILEDNQVLYIDRADAGSGIRMVANIGRHSALHATASGKVMLAFHPRLDVNATLDKPFRFTKTTLVDRAAILGQLERIRQEGYATCWQEHEVGLCSVAMPARDYTGTVAASVSLAGPSARLSPRSFKRLLDPLRECVTDLERRLGGRPAVDEQLSEAGLNRALSQADRSARKP